jgi:hypothetical protein
MSQVLLSPGKFSNGCATSGHIPTDAGLGVPHGLTVTQWLLSWSFSSRGLYTRRSQGLLGLNFREQVKRY